MLQRPRSAFYRQLSRGLLLAFIALFAVLIRPPLARASTTKQEVQERLVRIMIGPPEAPESCGVGVFLTPRLILTALHVLEPQRAGRPAPMSAKITLSTRSEPAYVVDVNEAEAIAERLPIARKVVPDLNTSAELYDVALLALAVPFPDIKGGPLALRHIPESRLPLADNELLGYDLDSCAKPIPHASIEVKTRLEVPRVVPYMSRSTKRMRLDLPEKPGTSGSPIWSNTYASVVAVYTGADKGAANEPDARGYATSLDYEWIQSAYYAETDVILASVVTNLAAFPQQWHFAFGPSVEGNHLRRFPDPSGLIAFTFGPELIVFPKSTGFASFGAHAGVGVPLGKTRTSYLDPSGQTPLDPARYDAYWGLRAEAGLELRVGRLSRLSVTAAGGLRAEYLSYYRPKSLEVDASGIGAFGRLRATFHLDPLSLKQRLSSGAIFIDFVAAYEDLPSTTYRYTGIGAELAVVERGWGPNGGIGIGYEY